MKTYLAPMRQRPRTPRRIPTNSPVQPACSVGQCACGGACPRCQTQLPVSQPSDAAEREADRIADSVLRAPPPAPAALARAPVLQRATAASGVTSAAPATVQGALQEAGQPLDQGTREFFEPRLGHNLSDVRIHTGVGADHSARALDARAYTFGHDVVFQAGEYSPHTIQGRRLLAHELVHVRQQAQTPSLARQIMRTPHAGCDRATTGVDDADARIDRAQLQVSDILVNAARLLANLDAKALALIDAHFHCPSPSQVKTISDNFDKMRSRILMMNPICADAAARPCTQGRDSGLILTLSGFTPLELCASAFTGDDEFRLVRAFLDPAARMSGLSPNCAETDPCYEDASVGAGTMIDNIDSYVRLALALNGATLTTPVVACTGSSAKRLHEVRKALAPPVPAGACAYDNCDDHESIHANLRLAISRSERALAALAGKPSDATVRALDAYFMDHGKTTVATARERLNCIKAALEDTLTNERYGCSTREAPIASVGGSEKLCEDNLQRVCLNRPYFGFGDRGRVTTLIHECGHRVGLSTRATNTEDTYSRERRFLALSTEEALRNTDSYALFVNAIVSGVPATLLFPIFSATLGGTFPEKGPSDFMLRVSMGAELQHPRLLLFHPELRVGVTIMHNPFADPDEAPAQDADLVASALLSVRIGKPGWRGGYLSLRGGPLFAANVGAKKPDDKLFGAGLEANVEAGWRWGKWDVAASGGVMQDPLREQGARNVYYGGVSISILTDFITIPGVYK